MKLGRPRKQPIDRLRAVAWYGSIVDAAEHEFGKRPSDWGIAKLFKERVGPGSLSNSANVAHYRRGDYSPNENTLRIVEHIYPGTRMVFDNGPQFSYLWEALSGDPQRAQVRIEQSWRTGVPVELQGSVRGVVPQVLAEQLGLTLRVRLAKEDKPLFRRTQDSMGLMVNADWVRAHPRMAGAVLTLAPTVTFREKERLKSWGYVWLPPIAELSYGIAQARKQGLSVLTVESEPNGLDRYGLSLGALTEASGFQFDLDEGPEPYEEVLIEGVWRPRSSVV